MNLTLNQLTIGYGGQALSQSLTLEIKGPVAVAICGPNGSGKSTLLKTLLGLLSPVSGNFNWDVTTRLGYVPQSKSLDSLFPVTVEEFFKIYESLNEMEKYLAHFELSSQKNQLLRDLSFGQKQCIYFIRALLNQPNVLILDEIFTALDKHRLQLMEAALDTFLNQGGSLFLVEHEIEKIKKYGNVIIQLEAV